MRGGVSIAMHTRRTDDGIERFKAFRGKEHGRAKSAYMVGEMEQDMKLWFVEPLRSQCADIVEKVVNGNSQLLRVSLNVIDLRTPYESDYSAKRYPDTQVSIVDQPM